MTHYVLCQMHKPLALFRCHIARQGDRNPVFATPALELGNLNTQPLCGGQLGEEAGRLMHGGRERAKAPQFRRAGDSVLGQLVDPTVLQGEPSFGITGAACQGALALVVLDQVVADEGA
ncbi:hypothetical protein [Nonomuraea dietziae]|uniref:hypothetical protein n=1 Tax=Nonomuraea dietziae TaxID=65515 RepID=UPI00342637B0